MRLCLCACFLKETVKKLQKIYIKIYVLFTLMNQNNNISETLLNHIINCNDYERLDKILYNNPDTVIYNSMINKTIKLRLKSCFDILMNYENLNLTADDYNESLNIAFSIYKRGKNDENKYFLNKLLEKNMMIHLDMINILIEYDLDLYNKYIDSIINDKDILIDILDNLKYNKTFHYFLELFNRDILTIDEKKNFVKQYVYVNYTYNNMTKVYEHFVNT